MEQALKISRTSAVLALVVVLLLVLLATHLGEAPRHLEGFWVGEESFLRQSGLEDMYLYVGRAPGGFLSALGGRSNYDAFLVMVGENEGLICNQALQLTARFGWGLCRRDVYTARVRAVADDAATCPLLAGDPALTLTLSPTKGTLALDDGGKVLAVFTKDAATTAGLETAA